MYIDIVPNRKSPPAILLRESVRQGQKIVKRTIANLSSLSIVQAQAIRHILKGEKLVRPEAHFDILCSSAHGSVQAVLLTMRRLGLDQLIASRRCPERDLVIAMIASGFWDHRASWLYHEAGRTRRWASYSGLRARMKTRCMQRWIGSMNVRSGSSRNWLSGIFKRGVGCCTTFLPVTLKASNVHWRREDTVATRRKGSYKLTTVY